MLYSERGARFAAMRRLTGVIAAQTPEASMAEVDEILAKILRLRGAEYVCLAHRTDGRIVGEAGHDGSATSPGGAAKLKAMLPEIIDSAAEDELEDIIVSSRHRYRLIRHIETSGAEPLLLYLHLRRPQVRVVLRCSDRVQPDRYRLIVR